VSDATPSLPAPTAHPRNGRSHSLPIFFLALLIGVGAHAAALFLFTWKTAFPASPPAPRAFVHFTKASNPEQDKIRSQEAEIFDPQLLYSPTARNYATREVGNNPSPQPRVFTADASQALPTPSAENFSLRGSSNSQSATPADALKPASNNFLGAFGQTTPTGSALPARGALLRIQPQQTGAGAPAAKDITWPTTMAPKAGNVLWQPATFNLLFVPTGLMGEPTTEISSGVQAVDDDLRAKLKDYFSHHSLPPGYYTIQIGP